MENSPKNNLRKKIVVKIGSNVLTDKNGKIDNSFLSNFTTSLAKLHLSNYEIIIVTSGAIKTGLEKLRIAGRYLSIPEKQAAAAIGQGLLIEKYTRLFDKHGITTAQVLLTRDIIDDRKKYLNTQNTFANLSKYNVIPIVNENDTVSYEEIKFGDNDTLSAITAVIVEADTLIILSDVKGLYDKNPKLYKDAKLIPLVECISTDIQNMACGPLPDGGVGGMKTKLKSAQIAINSGIKVIIAHGRNPEIVKRILDGEQCGTTFTPICRNIPIRKKWIAFGHSTNGIIKINEGAKIMILTKGKSLLPSGIIDVLKEFQAGNCVEIRDEQGYSFAKGISNYSSEDIVKIKGHHSKDIPFLIGGNKKIYDEVIHRDNLVVL